MWPTLKSRSGPSLPKRRRHRLHQLHRLQRPHRPLENSRRFGLIFGYELGKTLQNATLRYDGDGGEVGDRGETGGGGLDWNYREEICGFSRYASPFLGCTYFALGIGAKSGGNF